MGDMERAKEIAGAACVGLVAYWFAVGVGIDAWRNWLPGDAADIGLMTFIGIRLLRRRRILEDQNNGR